MEQKKKTPKKETLSDEEIVALYWQREERAITETARRRKKRDGCGFMRRAVLLTFLFYHGSYAKICTHSICPFAPRVPTAAQRRCR